MATTGIGGRDPDEDEFPDSDRPPNLGDRADTTGGVSKWGLGCGLLFIIPFFVGGCFGLITGIKGLQSGEKNAHIGVIVGSVFLIVSIAMLIGLFYGAKRSKAVREKRAEHPDQPWLWRADWAEGIVRCEGKVTVWAVCGFALVWNVISWGAVVAMWADLFSGKEKGVYFVLLFPFVGLFMIWWAAYAFFQYRKFGVSVFRMLANPGVLGGTLRGAVEIPVQVSPSDGFKVRLLCVHRYTSGTGDNRSTHEDTKWEDEKIIRKDLLSHDRTRTGVPVFFNIPYRLPRSNESPTYIWKLQIGADVPGIDYKSEFHVPVFKTDASDPQSKPVEDPTANFQPHGGAYQWPADDPIQLRDSGETIEAYFPPARNKGAIAFLFFFLLIWNGVIWFLIQEQAPILFPIVFGFFDLILLICFFSSLFYSSRIIAGPSGLQIFRRFLVPVGTTSVTPDQIRGIKVHSDMQSGDKQFYSIKAVLGSEKDTKLTSGIRDKKQAEWLADRFADCLGIKPKE
jgi:hypothetical protein